MEEIMNVLSINLTLGHLIVAAVLIVAYDAIWTFAFPDNTAKFWFARLQGWLKVAIYAGFIAFMVLFFYTPWPYNLVLVVTATLSIISFIVWLRQRDKSSPKEGANNENK